MCRTKEIILVLFTVWFAAIPALAGDHDGSRPLICAVSETFECEPGVECRQGTAESVNFPHFIKISFTEKIISSMPGKDPIRTTKIQSVAHANGNVVLQGVQSSKSWSMIVSETSGKITVSAADDQAGFVIFGACIPNPVKGQQ